MLEVNNGDDKININHHYLMNIYYWLEMVLRFSGKPCHVIITAILISGHFPSFYG